MWGATAVALLVSACGASQRQSLLIQEHQQVQASTQELRFEVVELARGVQDEIESGADRVRDSSEDPAVRRDALLWKVNAIPQVQTAALRSDPLTSGMDLWALVVQMRNFFHAGNGAKAFGEHARLAQEAMGHAEKRVDAVLARVSTAPGVEGRPIVEAWAAKHPIQGFDFHRDSLSTEYAISLRGAEEGGFGAVDEAQEGMERFEYRASLMGESLPKQARWNAELAVGDLLNTGALATQVNGILDAQRSAAFESVDRERALALDALTRERQAALKDASTVIDQQRAATMSDLDALIERHVERHARSMVDFALLRMGQVAAALAVLTLAVFGFIRWWRQREGKSGRFGAGRSGESWTPERHPGRRASDRMHPAY